MDGWILGWLRGVEGGVVLYVSERGGSSLKMVLGEQRISTPTSDCKASINTQHHFCRLCNIVGESWPV
jgi:hypothetical protein